MLVLQVLQLILKDPKTKINQITHYPNTIAFFHIRGIIVVNKVNLILPFAPWKTCFVLTGIDFLRRWQHFSQTKWDHYLHVLCLESLCPVLMSFKILTLLQVVFYIYFEKKTWNWAGIMLLLGKLGY